MKTWDGNRQASDFEKQKSSMESLRHHLHLELTVHSDLTPIWLQSTLARLLLLNNGFRIEAPVEDDVFTVESAAAKVEVAMGFKRRMRKRRREMKLKYELILADDIAETTIPEKEGIGFIGLCR